MVPFGSLWFSSARPTIMACPKIQTNLKFDITLLSLRIRPNWANSKANLCFAFFLQFPCVLQYICIGQCQCYFQELLLDPLTYLANMVVTKTGNVLCKPNKPGIKHYVKMAKT